MICQFFRHLKGSIICLGMLIFWLLISSTVVIVGALTYLLIIPKLRHAALGKVGHLALWWARSCRLLLLLGNRSKWNIHAADKLSKKDWYLLISNHRSWADIFILNVAFGHRIPAFKYFLKKQLLWQLPIGGLACWMLDYPFVSRHSKKAIRKNPSLLAKSAATMQETCAKLGRQPTTIIIFPEGTRCTPEKQQRQRSPYKHLLKPKSQGIGMVANALPSQLSTLLDVTITHSPQHISLWSLVCGDYDHIDVAFEKRNITDAQRGDFYQNRTYRKALQEWMNGLWAQKDTQLNSSGDKHA